MTELSNLTRRTWVTIGVVLLVLPALPVTDTMVTGLPWMPHLKSWAIGLVSVITAGLLIGHLVARGVPRPLTRWSTPDPRVVVPVLAVLTAGAAAWVMLSVFAGNPHLVDEMAQLVHARAFAAGRLAAPIPEPREAFLITHTWIRGPYWFSQYPPGFTALLALGLDLGVEWLINPLLGGLSVVLVFYAARGLYGPKTALTSAVLWAAAPWVMFMSGTYMNHVPATTLALAGCAFLWAPRRPRAWHALAAGFAVAGVAATRPLDAVAVALPMLVWIALHRRWRVLPLLALGGAPVMLAWAYFNWRLFGNPFTLGYDLLWGPEHGLGFHRDPWGEPYTLLVALKNMVLAVQRLNIYLYEWPIPALLPFVVWAVAGRQHGRRDLVLAAAVAAAPVLYFFYWHSGFYLGPRFYYAAAPFLVIGTARAWCWAWKAARRIPARFIRGDVALAACAVSVVVWGWLGVLPQRVHIYRTGLATLKQHPERDLSARGVRHALVLVPESWGSRVIVELWGLGVRPGTAERAYRRLDTCHLYQVAEAARTAGVDADAVESRLEQDMIFAPPAPRRLESWPDPSLRLRQGSTPLEECQVQLRRDLTGFTLFGYLAWRNNSSLDSGIVFARDLFERNEDLLRHYPGWEVWRYAPPTGRPDTLAVLTLVRAGTGKRANR